MRVFDLSHGSVDEEFWAAVAVAGVQNRVLYMLDGSPMRVAMKVLTGSPLECVEDPGGEGGPGAGVGGVGEHFGAGEGPEGWFGEVERVGPAWEKEGGWRGGCEGVGGYKKGEAWSVNWGEGVGRERG